MSYNNANFNVSHSRAVQIIGDYFEKISDVTGFNAELQGDKFKITSLSAYQGKLIPHLSYMSIERFNNLLKEALEFNCHSINYIRMRRILKDNSIYYQVGIRLVDDLSRQRKQR